MILNDLTDVTITAPLTPGMTLRYDGVNWENAPLDLNDLGDVTAVAPTDGQTIVWDSTFNAGAGGYVLGTAGGNATVHLTDTSVAPATVGTPTIAEITAAAGVLRDRVLTYTGTDLDTDPQTHVYHIDSDGLVTLLQSPAAGLANPIVHLTDTAVAPADPGSPTLAEITAAAGINRDVILTYTGTDNPADPVTHSYYIDQAGAVVLVDEPNTATCGLSELGGVGGTLAVGDGLGVPNPAQAGYTLSGDRAVGIATTAPAGGSTQFEVRLMPAGTVVTTGTLAAGATVATFTPFADLALAAGQWFETVITVAAPTPGAFLTVVGELCGPGTPTTVTAGGPDVDSHSHTQAAASTTWTIVHALGRPVAVRIEDTTGADITAQDINDDGAGTVVLTFINPIAGTAELT